MVHGNITTLRKNEYLNRSYDYDRSLSHTGDLNSGLNTDSRNRPNISRNVDVHRDYNDNGDRSTSLDEKDVDIRAHHPREDLAMAEESPEIDKECSEIFCKVGPRFRREEIKPSYLIHEQRIYYDSIPIGHNTNVSVLYQGK